MPSSSNRAASNGRTYPPLAANASPPASPAQAAGAPAAIVSTDWHTQTVAQVVQRFDTALSGLTWAEARRRLDQFGPNELQSAERAAWWHTLVDQFKNVLILILLAGTIVSGLLGHTLEATVITVIVLFAVLLGFFQEYRAERALEALREMAAPAAHVIRDGAESVVPARDVVPGDRIQVRTGDRIPADGRVVEAINLAVDEAALTGESAAVAKTTDALPTPDLPLGDRTNMVFAGTLVTHGRGQIVAVGTGMATEFGRITHLVQSVEAGRTPLQENLDRLGATLGKFALGIVALVVAVGLWRGLPAIDMFMFGIALAVAVVPEALPAVVTISLAIGVRRMVKRRALVRRLPVVETLGSTSVICSDKTGTLTRNEMTVRRLICDDTEFEITGAGYDPTGTFLAAGVPTSPPEAVRLLLTAAALASDARLVQREGRWTIEGDPTEGALAVAATKAGLDIDTCGAEQPRTDEIPFTSERRQMTTVHRTAVGSVAYSKGATDKVLAVCDTIWRDGAIVSISDAARGRVLDAEQRLARLGLRVLAVSQKTAATLADAERGMTLLGLIAMMDPPREEAAAAVRTCEAAGITTVMITGDHPLTAQTIASELGMLGSRRVVTGVELDAMGDPDLTRTVGDIGVYARVSPAAKLRVVEAWQTRGAVVAMTGDGVNDAPALKKADVGIAMGIAGTDVSKEAAGMTLLDDNFATIVAAVEEGRGVFGNIKKYLMYLLSCNVGEIVLLAGAVLAGLPMPLTAVQILYVNLATDGLPALALAVDPAEPDLMTQRPRDARRGIFTPSVVTLLLAGGLWSGLVNAGLFTYLLNAGRPLQEVMAMTFVTLVLIQFFNAYNCRSDHHSIVRRPWANTWLNVAVLWEVVLLLVILYVPFFQRAFGTFSLTMADWALTLGLAFSIVPVIEIVKWLSGREGEGGPAPLGTSA